MAKRRKENEVIDRKCSTTHINNSQLVVEQREGDKPNASLKRREYHPEKKHYHASSSPDSTEIDMSPPGFLRRVRTSPRNTRSSSALPSSVLRTASYDNLPSTSSLLVEMENQNNRVRHRSSGIAFKSSDSKLSNTFGQSEDHTAVTSCESNDSDSTCSYEGGGVASCERRQHRICSDVSVDKLLPTASNFFLLFDLETMRAIPIPSPFRWSQTFASTSEIIDSQHQLLMASADSISSRLVRQEMSTSAGSWEIQKLMTDFITNFHRHRILEAEMLLDCSHRRARRESSPVVHLHEMIENDAELVNQYRTMLNVITDERTRKNARAYQKLSTGGARRSAKEII